MLLILAVLPPGQIAAESEAASPTEVVETLHDGLIEVMKNSESLGYDGRARTLQPIVDESYDLPFMARSSVGRSWKDLGDEEKTRYTEAFSRLTVANYAGRFNGYEGQRFTLVGTEDGIQNTVLVKTRLLRANGEEVQLDYRLRQTQGRWRIIDVFLDGTISELALRRSEYSAVIAREGFPALLEAIEEKIASLRDGAT